MAQDIPPVPYQSPMTDQTGFPTAPWSDWFRKLLARVGGNLGNQDGWDNSQAPSGYQKFPSGTIIQWGQIGTISSGTNSSASFPIPFPNACLVVNAGIIGNSAGATTETGHWGTGNYSTSGFTLFNRSSAAYTFNFYAVGY